MSSIKIDYASGDQAANAIRDMYTYLSLCETDMEALQMQIGGACAKEISNIKSNLQQLMAIQNDLSTFACDLDIRNNIP